VAQEPAKIQVENLFYQIGPGPATSSTTTRAYSFVSSEFNIEGQVVKGAPYSAEAVTEMVQTLADGNRIVHRSTAARYRDGEGRTRQEFTMPMIAGIPPSADTPQIISISDPVAGVRYNLNPNEKTAIKTAAVRSAEALQAFKTKLDAERAASGGSNSEQRTMVITRDTRSLAPMILKQDGAAKPVVEKLGTQIIEGVVAEGTRSTTTIPAGQIGNERDLVIVTERWYAPSLKMEIMNKRNDPRTGESTFRLTNIRLAEPSPSLFQVPSDYTLQEPSSRRVEAIH